MGIDTSLRVRKEISLKAETELAANFAKKESREKLHKVVMEYLYIVCYIVCFIALITKIWSLCIVNPITIWMVDSLWEDNIERKYWAKRKSIVIKYLTEWRCSPYYKKMPREQFRFTEDIEWEAELAGLI